MSTPKSLRAAPQRRFEDYNLVFARGANVGLASIPDSAFTRLSGSTGDGYTDEGVSAVTPIGFVAQIDGVRYTRFVAGTNGWLALVDPSASSFVSGSVFTSGTVNAAIRSTFTQNHLLLCPWADDLRNAAANASDFATADEQRRIQEGTLLPHPQLSPSDFGVRYFHDKRSNFGERLIVRWSSIPNITASARIKFDAVVYESGRIEFRYPSRSNVVLPVTASAGEDATIGAFMNGSGVTWRFRDFSYGLGYRDNERQQYRFGGAVNGSYSDTADSFSVPYTVNLKPTTHWPGSSTEGAMYVFEPPRARRRVLPRKIVSLGDSRRTYPVGPKATTGYVVENLSFDDRRSASFVSGVLVNYPTTLPRFFGGSGAGVAQRLDLFSDFELTGSIVDSAATVFLNEPSPRIHRPFSEVARHDLHWSTSSVAQTNFFVSGTGGDLTPAMSSPLPSKMQVRLELPVKQKTTLFATTSSIHYFNNRVGAWQVPFNTTNGNTRTDIATANGAANLVFVDDARGFNALGNSIASASNSPLVSTLLYNLPNQATALHRSYDKSVTLNQEYAAIDDEAFTLPIEQPFLIEKIVIDVPIEAGAGWFADRTTSLEVVTTGSAIKDIGGPGITISLFNRMPIPGTGGRRDLIASGVISHTFDDNREIVVATAAPYDPTTLAYVRPKGLHGFNATPAAVITPASSSGGYHFTGSVVLKMDAAVSNGVTVFWNETFTADEMKSIFSQEEIEFGRANAFTITSANPFGRADTSFDPSGRSVFGREFVSSQGFLNANGRFANPLYITGTLPTQISGALNSAISSFKVAVAIPLERHFKSPYLVMPGDRLTLAVSKTRPAMFALNLTGSYPQFSGSSHDVKLSTGSINVTLFGSLLRNGVEFHDVTTSPADSDAVHEVISSGPVLDQFDVEYSQTMSGSYTDDYITGSMVTRAFVNGVVTLVSTDSSSSLTRGRAFSKLNARSASSLGTSSRELGTNPYLSVRVKPAWELAGTNRFVQATSPNERYYDSMMPSISECFSKDSTSIWIDEDGSNSYFADKDKVNLKNVGFMVFNQFGNDFTSSDLGENMVNRDWRKSFPFEPRYANVARQASISKQFTAKIGLSSPDASTIAPRQLTSFYCVTPMEGGPGYSGGSNNEYVILSDINLSSVTLATGSASNDDMSRFLFGFGDRRTYHAFGSTNYEGVTNDFHFRSMDWYMTNPFSGVVMYYCQGPIIRGWRYGVYNGLPTRSKAIWRRGHYGQLRDMLEQREYTKFYNEPNDMGIKTGVTTSPVTVRFVDPTGRPTKPENTSSQNLSFEATSSLPYFDGYSRNRESIDQLTLNTNVIQFAKQQFGNITL